MKINSNNGWFNNFNSHIKSKDSFLNQNNSFWWYNRSIQLFPQEAFIYNQFLRMADANKNPLESLLMMMKTKIW